MSGGLICVSCVTFRYIASILEGKDKDDFNFLPPGKAPEIRHRPTRERAKQAVFAAYKELKAKDEAKEPTCLDKFCNACARARKQREEKNKKKDKEMKKDKRQVDKTKLSPQMQKASSQGTNMLKKMFFPSMPALLQDLWVYTELIFTLIAFSFGLVGFINSGGATRIFSILYLVLAIISVILALIDAFIYFFQLGSCARLFRFIYKYCKAKRQRQHPETDLEQGEEEGSKKCCAYLPRLPEKWLTRFNQFFEIGRNIVSELILYPLLVFDLFDFEALGGIQRQTAEERLNFGLFCIGSFYLFLSVYVMRMFTIIGTMVSMLRLPLQTADGGKKQYVNFLVRFCIHAVFQLFVHLFTIVAVAAKIRNEDFAVGDDPNALIISAFLWVTMFLGWIIPLAGVFVFFIVNYYWTKEFSISFWVDMISLLQGQGFAEAVFGGEGVSATKETAEHLVEKAERKKLSPEAKERTLDFVEKSGLNEVKKQLKTFKSPSFFVKFVHPIRLPFLCILGLLYNICVIAFGVSIALTVDSQTGQVCNALSGDPFLLASFVVLVFFMVLANFHVLILMNGFILVALFVLVLAAIYVVVSVPLILLSLPVMGIIGYCKFWRRSQKIINHSLQENGKSKTTRKEKSPAPKNGHTKTTNTEKEEMPVPKNEQPKITEIKQLDDAFEITVDL